MAPQAVITAQSGYDDLVTDSHPIDNMIDSNPTSLSRAQKAAMTRKRNQVAQMVADITEKTPGPRLAKTVALKNAIWKDAQRPTRKRATPPGSPQKAVRTKKSRARTYRPPTVNRGADEESSTIGTLVPVIAGFVADGTPRECEGKANEDAAARFEGQHLDDPFVENGVPCEHHGKRKAKDPFSSDRDGYQPDIENSDQDEDEWDDELEDDEDGDGEDVVDDEEEEEEEEDNDNEEEEFESDGSFSNKGPKVAAKMLTEERPVWAPQNKDVGKPAAVLVRNRIVSVSPDEDFPATAHVPTTSQRTNGSNSQPRPRLSSKFTKVQRRHENDMAVPRAVDDIVPTSKPKPRPLSNIRQAQQRNENGPLGHQKVSRQQQKRDQEVPVWSTENASQSTGAAVQSGAPLPMALSTQQTGTSQPAAPSAQQKGVPHPAAPSTQQTGMPQPAAPSVQPVVQPTVLPPAPSTHETTWPQCAVLHLNSIGDVNLRDQSVELRVIIQSSIHKILSWIIFTDAFPSLVTRGLWNRDALLQTSSDFISCSQATLKEKYQMIKRRVSLDPSFVKNIGRLPDARISIYQGGFKSACVQIVPRFYNLKEGCAETVHDLVTNDKFIFCLTSNNQVIGHKPYEHPAIAEVIKQRLFDDVRYPITEEFPEFFTEGEKLTQSIIAFAATAIQAAIQEWVTGKRIPQEFTAHAFTDVYLNHMALLNLIKKHKPRAHDYLLTRLFRVVSGNRLKKVSGTAYLDMNNMHTVDSDA
ncbi:hypothetical protein JOM56_014976 [Amanita muscaria]